MVCHSVSYSVGQLFGRLVCHLVGLSGGSWFISQPLGQLVGQLVVSQSFSWSVNYVAMVSESFWWSLCFFFLQNKVVEIDQTKVKLQV